MRAQFREWYPIEADELGLTWSEGMVVLDSGALLGLYRMAEPTANFTLELMDWLEDRLWVPYQAAYEFHKNRLGVIEKQARAYEDLRDGLKKFPSKLEERVGRHGVLRSASFFDEVRRKATELVRFVDELEAQHPWPPADRLNSSDPILKRLDQILDGRVGTKLEFDAERVAEAEQRLANEIPPGYRDNWKGNGREFGDLLVWWECLAEVAESEYARNGVLLVTEDMKDDWWWIENGQRLGPRRELVAEALTAGAGSFWIQSLVGFSRSGADHRGWELPDMLVASEHDSEPDGPEHPEPNA